MWSACCGADRLEGHVGLRLESDFQSLRILQEGLPGDLGCNPVAQSQYVELLLDLWVPEKWDGLLGISNVCGREGGGAAVCEEVA